MASAIKHTTKVGEVYGSLTITSEPFHVWSARQGQKHRHVMARCKCGSVRRYFLPNITAGRSRQCKQCATESMKAAHTRHGMVGTRTYATWRSVLRRHGGVDPRWRDFSTFLRDIGGPIQDGVYVNTIDSRKPVGPDNFELSPISRGWGCRHAHALNGLSLEEAAVMLGVTRQRVQQLLKKYGDLDSILKSRGIE